MHRSVGVVLAVGVAYFLAARFGLALRAQAGLAIFWPAAGIAVSALMLLGPSARLAIAAVVTAATIAALLISDKSPGLAIALGFVNAGQALLAAWLIERWFGDAFQIEDVPRVLGFLVACAVGAAVGATGAAIARAFLEPIAFLQVWRLWFAACLLGMLTVAPLLIGLGQVVRDPPSRRELIEGSVGVSTLAVLTVFLISLPQEPWESALPVAMVFPVLLWVTVRCRPVFAAAAAFVVALTIVASTTSSIGHFGDANVPIADRILAAQTYVLGASLLSLVLAALFADRKRAEAALKERNEQFELASKVAQVGTYSYDYATRILQLSPGCATIYGLSEDTCEITQNDWRGRVHLEDLPRIDAASRQALMQRQAEFVLEFRIVRPDGDVRWIEARTLISYDGLGRAVQMTGANIDVTDRKQTTQDLAERNAQLALAGRAARVGSYAYDTGTEVMQISEGYAAIHGFPEGTAEITRRKCLATLHPEDIERADLARSEAFRERRTEYSVEYRINRPDGEIRWVETRCFISYDSEEHPQRVVGVSIDTTGRKQAEARLAERTSQFDLARRAARVGTYTYDNVARIMQLSEASAAIIGLPQSITEITADDWRGRVHPDDVPRLETERRRAFKERQPELVGEFRIVLPSGDVRWIEARALITYNASGHARRMIGVYIDVTERRQAEDHKSLLIAELDHRVKNILACVAAVAQHTRDTARSMDDFLRVLEGRLHSLANAHSLLSRNHWRGVSIAELVRGELAPCMKDGNTLIDGPDIVLAAEATQPVSMVLHELATNATKYGALSNSGGRVSVCWRKSSNDGPTSRLLLEWREVGGPLMAATKSAGYGTTVIRDLIPYELGGTVDYQLAAGGVRCTVELPAKWLNSATAPRDAAGPFAAQQ